VVHPATDNQSAYFKFFSDMCQEIKTQPGVFLIFLYNRDMYILSSFFLSFSTHNIYIWAPILSPRLAGGAGDTGWGILFLFGLTHNTSLST
jgi:hypothetical protein